MISALKALSSKESFKVCLLLLDVISNCVIEDYPIAPLRPHWRGAQLKQTNHSFLNNHLSKNKIKEFRATIRRNIKFLKKSLTSKNTDIKKLVKLKLQLTDWHKYLVQHHMHMYTQNKTYGWNYLGLSLHYLLDAYYHIYSRLIAAEPSCSWCNKNLNYSWEEILHQIMVHHLPTIYLYLSLSQNIYLDEPITKETVDSHMSNVKSLLQNAIKIGILNLESDLKDGLNPLQNKELKKTENCDRTTPVPRLRS